jgi:hypothetical protein
MSERELREAIERVREAFSLGIDVIDHGPDSLRSSVLRVCDAAARAASGGDAEARRLLDWEVSRNSTVTTDTDWYLEVIAYLRSRAGGS